jgi:cytochrome c-type biogenesis protein CcmH/NrfF
LIACLEGSFDPQTADRLLKSVRFSYSVRWVDGKTNKTKVIWGIPLGILGAVVNSLFFVSILCVISMLIGAIVAVVRFSLRTSSSKHSTGDEEETHISRLRL